MEVHTKDTLDEDHQWGLMDECLETIVQRRRIRFLGWDRKHRLQRTILDHFSYDIQTANQLSVHPKLRKGRPVRERLETLSHLQYL